MNMALGDSIRTERRTWHIMTCKAYWVDKDGHRLICLDCGELLAEVDPSNGMNLMRLRAGQRELLLFDGERQANGRTTGMPLLFPTPNRVRNEVFRFEGLEVPAMMHGFARHQAFENIRLWTDGKTACVEGELHVGSADGGQTAVSVQSSSRFPFRCRLLIRMILSEHELKYQYEVRNDGTKRLPFGFGLHPFFRKEDARVWITSNMHHAMRMDADRLPDGTLVAASDTGLATGVPTRVDDLRLDHVFTGMTRQPAVILDYPDLSLEMTVSPDFGHLVVYTPEFMPWYCVENQTCSTDAHNLSDMGFGEVSGLQVVEPGARASGEVNWIIRIRPDFAGDLLK